MADGVRSAKARFETLRVLYDFVIFRMERRGGVSRYITELARRLAASGEVAPTIFAAFHGNAFVGEQTRTSGVNVIGRSIPLAQAQSSAVGILDYAAFNAYHKLGPSQDVYHPSYYPRSVRRRPARD